MTDKQNMEKYGASLAEKKVEEILNVRAQTVQAAQAAYRAYKADMRDKQDRIENKVRELRERLNDLTSGGEDYGPALASATLSGDTEAWNAIQEKIRQRESEKATLAAQIEILNNANIDPDPALETAFLGAVDTYRETSKRSQNELAELVSFAKQQRDAWAKVATHERSLVMGAVLQGPEKMIVDEAGRLRAMHSC